MNERERVHRKVAAELAGLDDGRLDALVRGAEPLGAGIGGRSAALDVAGARVFVKRVPLTDVELEPGNVRSTRNVFGLPLPYHYRVGSCGIGAWRELAVHEMTTAWVLGGAYGGFPLTYHWRVLPDTPPPGFVDEFGGIDGSVAYWGGSPAVRARLEAIAGSRHSLVLFLEHIPHTLAAHLAGQSDPAEWARVEREVLRGADFMADRGLVHFDAHFENVLTDGGAVYFADYGLALSDRFELAPDERAFLADHLGYDRATAASQLLRHPVVKGVSTLQEQGAFLDRWAAGDRPPGTAPEVAAMIDRHLGPVRALGDFCLRQLADSPWVPYPAADISGAA
ncbi:protein kinase family protein [Streptomyces sp. MS19]|uniref:protein kinase family protein n=1 Tax=Streptomyces sp. MS19 TaxID=3385972 RepID=UPI00399F31F6